jgi:hypothetical protein
VSSAWAGRHLAGALVFALALAVYASTGGIQPGNDGRPAQYLPSALLDHGALSFAPEHYPFMFEWAVRSRSGSLKAAVVRTPEALAEAQQRYDLVLLRPKYYLVQSTDGRYFSAFGEVAGLCAVPLALLLRALALGSADESLAWSAFFTANLLVAGAAAWVFAAAARRVTVGRALCVAAAFAFGSSALSVSSQAPWQHAPCTLGLAAAAYYVVRLDDGAGGAVRLALALSFAVWSRPTAAVAATVLGLWVLVSQPAARLRFCAAAAPWAAAYLARSTILFGGPLEQGQLLASRALAAHHGPDGLWGTPLWLGALGLLFSPGRGLFVHSPVFALSFARLRMRGPFLPLLGAVLAMTAVASRWHDWWGGFCFGPRPLADSAPFLALLLVPGLADTPWRSARAVLFAGLLALSSAVHAIGAYVYEPIGWNERAGENVGSPAHRARLWDARDSQIAWFATHLAAERARRTALRALWVREPER